MPQNFLKNRHQNGESLHVPVVIDGGDPVGFQMEGVDHVHVVQIRRGGLVGQVHRMVQRHVPDGEGLKFGVARRVAPDMLVVQLAQAGRQLAAAGAGGRDHHQRPGRLNVVIFPEAVGADDVAGVGGVARNFKMVIDPDAQPFQAGLERLRQRLFMEAGQHHAGNVQAEAPENVDQANDVPVIGDAKIAPNLILFDIVGVDGNDHLHLLLQLQQHPQLAVRLEARQDAGSMVVVIELAAEFEIQLAAELGNALPDVGGLHLQVLIVIKRRFCHFRCLFPKNSPLFYLIRREIASRKSSEALIKSARAVSERFFGQSKYRKRRNTVCISRFRYGRMGEKDPLTAADDLFRVSLLFCRIASCFGNGAVL